MFEIETSAIPSWPPLQRETETPVMQRLNVPLSVVNKYNVETTNDSVEELITRYKDEPTLEKEAFYIINLSTVVKKYVQWITNLPRVKPFYAVKCNPNNAIVQTLGHLTANFDCASKGEIQQVLDNGVSPSRIIFANPTKQVSHILYAKEVGVEMMTFDNTHELDKIASCYPDSKLVLRIITDDSNSVCRFSTKFGAPLNVCPSILAHAKALGLNVIGVSFHVGSGCMSVRSFEAAIRSAAQVFQMGKEAGYNFNLLDIGGGWPGTDGDGIRFNDIAQHIAPILDELFPAHIEIIAEPGRYFVAESHTLALNVFAKRTMESETGKSFLYYVNDGVYQSFNCIFFDHAHPQPLVFEPKGRTEVFPATVFGPTCDSMDCIARNIELPELEVGEWLYFKSMGAYTTAAASPFNGFKAHPTTFYIQ